MRSDSWAGAITMAMQTVDLVIGIAPSALDRGACQQASAAVQKSLFHARLSTKSPQRNDEPVLIGDVDGLIAPSSLASDDRPGERWLDVDGHRAHDFAALMSIPLMG